MWSRNVAVSRPTATTTTRAVSTTKAVSVSEMPKRFSNGVHSFQHSRQCKVNNPVIQQPRKPSDPVKSNGQMAPAKEQRIEQFYWKEVKGEMTNMINKTYQKIDFWRKDFFMLLNGAAGKKFIRYYEINSWCETLHWLNYRWKLFISCLYLSCKSLQVFLKAKIWALERRLEMWHKGHIDLLFNEAKTLQFRLPKIEGKKT